LNTVAQFSKGFASERITPGEIIIISIFLILEYKEKGK